MHGAVGRELGVVVYRIQDTHALFDLGHVTVIFLGHNFENNSSCLGEGCLGPGPWAQPMAFYRNAVFGGGWPHNDYNRTPSLLCVTRFFCWGGEGAVVVCSGVGVEIWAL